METWEDRARMAKVQGWKHLWAAMQCFRLGDAADAQAKKERKPRATGRER